MLNKLNIRAVHKFYVNTGIRNPLSMSNTQHPPPPPHTLLLLQLFIETYTGGPRQLKLF
jgi:hypothetical protein